MFGVLGALSVAMAVLLRTRVLRFYDVLYPRSAKEQERVQRR
jgi:hypothetical protein